MQQACLEELYSYMQLASGMCRPIALSDRNRTTRKMDRGCFVLPVAYCRVCRSETTFDSLGLLINCPCRGCEDHVFSAIAGQRG